MKTFFRQLFRFRFDRSKTYPRQYNILITHWFYFTNQRYIHEKYYFVRIGQWRKNFGPIETKDRSNYSF